MIDWTKPVRQIETRRVIPVYHTLDGEILILARDSQGLENTPEEPKPLLEVWHMQRDDGFLDKYSFTVEDPNLVEDAKKKFYHLKSGWKWIKFQEVRE